MATIKSYTDIEQSRKLAEFLPTESADMYYKPADGFCTETSEIMVGNVKYAHPRSVPCWSLAGLLDVLPKSLIYTPNPTLDGYYCKNIMHDMETYGKNPVDACYELVLKLHELKML